MRLLTRHSYLTTFLLLLLTPLVVLGHKEHLVVKDDPRSAFAIESFGFEPGGKLSLYLEELVLLVIPDQYTKRDNFELAFVLQRSMTDAVVKLDENTSSGTCFHTTGVDPAAGDQVIPLPRERWKAFRWEKTIDVAGDYHLYFSNCELDTQVNLDLHLEEYNLVDGTPMYLSAGEASLPTWYFVLSGLFLAEVLAWCSMMLRNRTELKHIHWLMLATVVVKFISVILQSIRYHFFKWSGVHSGWFWVYYIFAVLKGILMFCVIVLIGTGWSYLKPFLTERDKNLMLAVIVAQIFLNVAMVIVSESAPGSREAQKWGLVLNVLDIVCCCLILLPIVWSIKHLRLAAGTDSKDSKLNRNLERLKRFRTFYLVTVAFVYFTRIIVFLLHSTLPFEMTWLASVFSELASLLFYAATGAIFAPGRKNPYLSLSTEDEETELTGTNGSLVDLGEDGYGGHAEAPIERL